MYSEQSLDISSGVPDASSGSSLIMGHDAADLPCRATQRMPWPIAAASLTTCFCCDFVRVRYTTLRPRSIATDSVPASADTVFPVPVPASTTGHMPSDTDSEMKRTSSP